MAAVSFTREFNALATTTQDNFRKKMIDNIFKGVPFLDWLLGKGRVRREPGGLDLVEHLMYGTNSTVQAISGYDPMDMTPQEGFTIARYNWREYTISTVISRREKNQNSGSQEQLINLWKAKLKQTELSFRDRLATDALGSQSGKTLDGLGNLIGTSAGTVGGINETNESWWAPYRKTSGVTYATLKDWMRTGINTIGRSIADDRPDLLLTNQTLHEVYEDSIEDVARFALARGKGDQGSSGWGLDSLSYKGVPLVWDPHIADNDNRVYLLNSNYLSMVLHTDGDFVMSPVRSPVDQYVSVSDVYFMGNITTNKRSAQGIISGVTAS